MEGVIPQERFSVHLVTRTWLSTTVFEVELERPPVFSFRAGQSVRVYMNGEGRDYSLASGPAERSLRLCVRLVEGGVVSPFLATAPAGASLELSGPRGLFSFAPSPRPVVWAATGVGIAPFLSMARDGAAGFTLLHGVREAVELFCRDELGASASRLVPCVSRETAPGCFHGRVTDWAAANLGPGAYDFSLCGNRRMVGDFTVLVDERFPGFPRVHRDLFLTAASRTRYIRNN